MNEINKLHYIKTSIVSLGIFAASIMTGNSVINYVQTQNYFSFPIEISLKFVGYSLLLLILYAISVGCWNKYDQYIYVITPISLGIFFNLLHLSILHAASFTILSGLILIFFLHRATKLKHLLLEFIPSMILNHSGRVILMIFSIMSAYAMFLNFAGNHQDNSIGDFIAITVKDQINNMSGGPFELIREANIPLDEIIKNNVNAFIEPYKQFTTPIIALIIFSYFQLLSWISFSLFALLIEPLFWILKKTGIYKIEVEDVKQETLSF